ncbi:ras-domain-containing protein [Pseudovirgaria hyperparasitica]|uniref:Ras-domain-containing protein n=1 Tax=Pseudovirgaria hyperparasitica TaxID=470096 RepID=A0A6A6W956_9PEZI|nr:ras-domain-containing protein [Pseudovirgaria hyperparasitica]KAF2758554.1 ras-domain-containing protein [Pseudovirgaria hyperparasitica]
MARKRAPSNVSMTSEPARDQELGGMYDYLAKVILLGPSGCGKSCLLHRFVKNEWRILSSQTIGVEFASKIVKIGTGTRRKRIKLQLWDTAGTERFRSVSRSYYRGAAGAILVYDVSSIASFQALPTFLNDARALASPDLTVILAGNKADIENESVDPLPPHTPSSLSSKSSSMYLNDNYSASSPTPRTPKVSRSYSGLGTQSTMSTAPYGREVPVETASRWAGSPAVSIPVCVEVSAYTADGVDELFNRLARMILTKIELGEIDPDDPASGIQYGDSGGFWGEDGGSIKSGTSMSFDDGGTRRRRRKGKQGTVSLGDWGDVFRRPRRGGCC